MRRRGIQGVSEVYMEVVVQYREGLCDLKQDWVSCGSVLLLLYAAVGLQTKS